MIKFTHSGILTTLYNPTRAKFQISKLYTILEIIYTIRLERERERERDAVEESW